jgi:hypothetical protein
METRLISVFDARSQDLKMSCMCLDPLKTLKVGCHDPMFHSVDPLCDGTVARGIMSGTRP